MANRYAKWTLSDGKSYNGQAHFACSKTETCVGCHHFHWENAKTEDRVKRALAGNASLSPHGYGWCSLQREMAETQGRKTVTQWLFPSRAPACKYFQQRPAP